jgi:choline dehydrogenase
MEGDGGASIIDLVVRNGCRQSVFRSYVFPFLDRPNLTVLSDALVNRLTFDRFEPNRVTGVEFSHNGDIHRVGAGSEVVLSLGAIHTPKLLMQSGIGDNTELLLFGIPVVQHLPGSVKTCRTIRLFPVSGSISSRCRRATMGVRRPTSRKSGPALDTPDLQTSLGEFPLSVAETAASSDLPEFGWGWGVGLVRPKSRGRICLTGPDPSDLAHIESNMLSHPDDLKAAIAGVQLCREIGNSAALRPFAKRESCRKT